MTPEEKHLLEQVYKLAEENNEMIRSMRRANRIGVVFRVIYWVVIIGASIGAFYFIQPYFESLMGAYSGVMDGINGVKSLGDGMGDLLR